MAFTVIIDAQRRRVTSTWQGAVDRALLFEYVEHVWRDPAARELDELVDFRAVTAIDLPSEAIAELARFSRRLDNPAAYARSAVVAAGDLAFGLSRMFATLRASNPDDRREFRVFADAGAAEQWLALPR
ncbi:MAG: hypothetical protein RLW62_15435 [Gammaproteobacteria bacterium]